MVEGQKNTPTPVENEKNMSGNGLKTALTGASVALMFLVIGVGAGYVLFNSPTAEPETQNDLLSELRQTTPVTGISVVMAGTITDINGRELTIERNGGTIAIAIRVEEPNIGRIENPDPEDPSGFPQMNPIAFEDLSLGDHVSVTATIKDDDKLEGVSVTVVPDENMLPRTDQ